MTGANFLQQLRDQLQLCGSYVSDKVATCHAQGGGPVSFLTGLGGGNTVGHTSVVRGGKKLAWVL